MNYCFTLFDLINCQFVISNLYFLKLVHSCIRLELYNKRVKSKTISLYVRINDITDNKNPSVH